MRVFTLSSKNGDEDEDSAADFARSSNSRYMFFSKGIMHLNYSRNTESIRGQSSARSCQAGSIIATDENVVEIGTNRIFLNAEDPAECDGKVYGWHICRPRDSNVQNSEVIIAMYREVPSALTDRNIFTVVGDSLKDLNVSEEYFDDNDKYGLECLDYMLEPSDHFKVKRGDVVGVCYESSENRLELVVEEPAKEIVILDTDTESCFTSNGRISSHSPRVEVTLLLSVYIGKCFSKTSFRCYVYVFGFHRYR